jgi:formate hydrogenlyase transcriptional activator
MAADLIGNSPKLEALMEAVATVATVDTTVLLVGETGTGKELIARAIHEQSARRRAPLVAVNCAALPTSLLESELFGHERGAFTGAVAQTMGRFQAAHGGTLFLDEIGDLPLETQPKLLRALQERQVERLGSGGRAHHVDARVIAATNQDLPDMVQRGSFRADLYYRLNVFPIWVPALRERLEDIPLLVTHFVEEFVRRHGKHITSIPDEALETLMRWSWPGNVRELQNVIERAVISTRDGVLRISSDERASSGNVRPSSNLADVTREHILAVLAETNWVVGGPRGAAARLGLCRTTLLAKMQRLGIARQTSVFSERRPPRGGALETSPHE